jgi:hypothetical protein
MSILFSISCRSRARTETTTMNRVVTFVQNIVGVGASAPTLEEGGGSGGAIVVDVQGAGAPPAPPPTPLLRARGRRLRYDPDAVTAETFVERATRFEQNRPGVSDVLGCIGDNATIWLRNGAGTLYTPRYEAGEYPDAYGRHYTWKPRAGENYLQETATQVLRPPVIAEREWLSEMAYLEEYVDDQLVRNSDDAARSVNALSPTVLVTAAARRNAYLYRRLCGNVADELMPFDQLMLPVRLEARAPTPAPAYVQSVGAQYEHFFTALAPRLGASIVVLYAAEFRECTKTAPTPTLTRLALPRGNVIEPLAVEHALYMNTRERTLGGADFWREEHTRPSSSAAASGGGTLSTVDAFIMARTMGARTIDPLNMAPLATHTNRYDPFAWYIVYNCVADGALGRALPVRSTDAVAGVVYTTATECRVPCDASLCAIAGFFETAADIECRRRSLPYYDVFDAAVRRHSAGRLTAPDLVLAARTRVYSSTGVVEMLMRIDVLRCAVSMVLEKRAEVLASLWIGPLADIAMHVTDMHASATRPEDAWYPASAAANGGSGSERFTLAVDLYVFYVRQCSDPQTAFELGIEASRTAQRH